MRAVVFAAGMGNRLRPLTSYRPKHLLPIVGKPILIRVLEALSACGIKDVGMTIGYKGDAIKDVVEKEGLPLKITFIKQEELLGTAHALITCREFLKGHGQFLAVYGDVTVTDEMIMEMLDSCERFGWDGAILASIVKEAASFGLIEEFDGILKGIVEKPSGNVKDSYVNAGAYILTPESLDYFDEINPSKRGEYELTDILNLLVRDGYKVGVVKVREGLWFDIGRPWDLLDANARYIEYYLSRGTPPSKDGLLIPSGESVRVQGAEALGPCYIGKDITIGSGTRIMPYTVIMDNVKIGNDCYIRGSLIMENSVVGDGTVLISSVVGEGASLGAGCTTRVRLSTGESIKMLIAGKLMDSGKLELGAVISPFSKVPSGWVFEPGEVYGQGA